MNVHAGMLYAEANSYENSKKHLSSLAINFSTVPFHIITGAPEDVIADEEIVCLSNYANISVFRKRSLLQKQEDYQVALMNYYKKTIQETLKNRSTQNL
ncbi:MAG: hypothetical protein ACK4GL_03845 [Flavobacteriales bacterium]